MNTRYAAKYPNGCRIPGLCYSIDRLPDIQNTRDLAKYPNSYRIIGHKYSIGRIFVRKPDIWLNIRPDIRPQIISRLDNWPNARYPTKHPNRYRIFRPTFLVDRIFCRIQGSWSNVNLVWDWDQIYLIIENLYLVSNILIPFLNTLLFIKENQIKNMSRHFVLQVQRKLSFLYS